MCGCAGVRLEWMVRVASAFMQNADARKYADLMTQPNRAVLKAQVALKYVVQHGSALVTRALDEEYLDTDIDLFNWNLTSSDIAALDAATDPMARPCLLCTSN